MSYLFTDAEVHKAIGGSLTKKNWDQQKLFTMLQAKRGLSLKLL